MLGDQVHFSENNTVAEVEIKPYKNFEEEGLKPSSMWKEQKLQPVPPQISPEAARNILEQGKEIKAKNGDSVVFDSFCIYHWEVEEQKNENEINTRLAQLQMAIDTVTLPLEIWDQGTQFGFVKAFQKSTGGFRGCLVFVLKNKKVRSYFLKDLNALDKARKGFSVQRFDDEKSTD